MFDKICSFENLHRAYLGARKCKRNRSEILKFNYHLEENLLKLQQELLSQTYQHGGYRQFIICDSKKRRIKAAPFKDRVIHHALCNIIEPIFDKGFIFDSYACRGGKGTHRALKRLQRFLKSISESPRKQEGERIYALKGDISKYFDNINHKILLEMIKKKITDQKVVWLTDKIADSSHEKPQTGIPIGNLTSQLFANIYLNELDKFVKHNLRVKYYLRYMDDFLILSYNKRKLRAIKLKIQKFLKNKLLLELHSKKVDISPAEKGIDFLGYVNFQNYRLLRKSTVKRFIKRTREKIKKDSARAWMNYAQFGNSRRLIKNLEEKLKIKLT